MDEPNDDARDALVNQRIFDTIIDLILVVDRQGDIERVSPSALSVLGYTPDEMVGHSAREFLYPADLEATRDEMRSLRRGNPTRHFECRYVHKSGAVVSLVWTGVWYEPAMQYYFIGRDVTDLRAVEQLEQIETTLRSISQRMRRMGFVNILREFDISMLEWMLAINSLWVGLILITPPSNFQAYPSNFILIRDISAHEVMWGYFALVAAALKITGISISFIRRRRLANIFRVTGLAMSGMFWGLMGSSALYGVGTSSMFGMLGISVGIAAWWSCLRITW